jgi:hypothetical protein
VRLLTSIAGECYGADVIAGYRARRRRRSAVGSRRSRKTRQVLAHVFAWNTASVAARCSLCIATEALTGGAYQRPFGGIVGEYACAPGFSSSHHRGATNMTDDPDNPQLAQESVDDPAAAQRSQAQSEDEIGRRPRFVGSAAAPPQFTGSEAPGSARWLRFRRGGRNRN